MGKLSDYIQSKREYYQDKKKAAAVPLDDIVLQKVIFGLHWKKKTDEELMRELNLTERELRVYKIAYYNYSNFMCF